MFKQISFLIILFFASVCVFTQTEKYTEPVNWERYKVSGKEVSLLFPKMPVLINNSDACNDLEADTYLAYAEEVVYQFRVAEKSKQKIPFFCTEKNKFSQKTFERRLEELRKTLKEFEETKLTINEKEVFKLSGNFATYWIFNDLRNIKWFELSVTHREDIAPKAEQFINSIEFGKNPNGSEIQDGALQTLGDQTKADENKSEEKTQQNAGTEKNEPMIIVAKPRASYTDAARRSQTQGKVMLRVIFLANGGIGSISPANELQNGLTEQAIAAAKKIVFIPAKRNGKTYNVAKQVQYNFSIY
jgi:hypothetical protein